MDDVFNSTDENPLEHDEDDGNWKYVGVFAASQHQ